jgi:hypothetical protein
VVFLKEYRSFGWRALFSHASVGVWWVWEWFPLFTVWHRFKLII